MTQQVNPKYFSELKKRKVRLTAGVKMVFAILIVFAAMVIGALIYFIY